METQPIPREVSLVTEPQLWWDWLMRAHRKFEFMAEIYAVPETALDGGERFAKIGIFGIEDVDLLAGEDKTLQFYVDIPNPKVTAPIVFGIRQTAPSLIKVRGRCNPIATATGVAEAAFEALWSDMLKEFDARPEEMGTDGRPRIVHQNKWHTLPGIVSFNAKGDPIPPK